MTLHRMARLNRRRAAAVFAAAGLAITGLAVTTSTPAQAALPSQCVTSGSQVICTLSQNTNSHSMALHIPVDVSSIQVHAVGEKGEGARGAGAAGYGGGKPAVIDASIPVTEGQVVVADLLDDGGAAGASSGEIEAGAGGSSVTVTRGSDVIIQAAGGGGAGAFVPDLDGGQYTYSAGGNADSYGFRAADNATGDRAARGGMPGRQEYPEGGFGGPGASVWNCPNYLTFPNGANGTTSSGGSGGDGGYGGGGGGGGSLGGGGGGAGGTGCEGYSYGGGGGGGGSILPWNATYSYSTTESYLVRITFVVGAQPPVTSTHSPAAISFGQVAVGSTSAAQTMTVTNTGSAPLTLGSGVLGGANPGSFHKSVNDSCSNATVAPGSTCQVGLQFKPLTSGNLSATFTITDNSANSPHLVNLSGTGLQAVAVSSVATLAFGSQEVGKPGPGKIVTLTNSGNSPLVVSGTSFSGANAPDFSTLTNTCVGATLSPYGQSCSVSVRMTASAEGQRLGGLTFTHNGSTGSTAVNLTGIGTPPSDLAIRGIGTAYTGRDHLVTRTVAGPGKLMIYPLVILNETSVARTYKIRLTKSGSASHAEVWTTGFGARALTEDSAGDYHTAVVQPNKTVSYSLRVTPQGPGQTISGVDVALLTPYDGLIESVRTETNTAAPAKGTSSFELFSRQGSQPFVGGPVSGQTSTGPALAVGGAASFTLRLKNDGASARRIGLRLSDFDKCAGSFVITATAAGKSITTAAFDGNYLTPLLAPTKFQDVFVTIKRVAAGCPSQAIRAYSLSSAAGPIVRTSYLLANVAYNAATD